MTTKRWKRQYFVVYRWIMNKNQHMDVTLLLMIYFINNSSKNLSLGQFYIEVWAVGSKDAT